MQEKDDVFAFISHVIVDKYCQTQEQLRRQQIAQWIVKGSAKKKRPFKIVNELILLMQKEPYFKPISNNFKVLSEICQKMEYREYRKGQNIYSFHEPQQFFYMLLSGVVHITVPEKIKEETDSKMKMKKKESHQREQPINFLQTKNPLLNLIQQNSIIEKLQDEEKILNILEAGECFGDLSEQGMKRQTNARVMEDAGLIVFDRSAYETLLSAKLKSLSNERYQFLKGLPIFQPVSPFFLWRICLSMTDQHLNYGQVLFNSHQKIDKIYVVQSGCFKLSKKINRRSVTQNPRQKLQYKLKIETRKDAEFLTVHKGQILGDYEVLNQEQFYKQTCVCENQEGVVLSISHKRLFKILMDDQENFQTVKKIIGSKNKWKNKVVSSFIEKRSRNSYMNSYLQDQKRVESCYIQKKQQTMKKLKTEVPNDDFFYHSLNKTIEKDINKQRFSLSRDKCKTQNRQHSKNLFAIKTKNRQKIPHGVQDIVELVKLKTNFQKRFRKGKKVPQLFKFNSKDVPLYIKSKFNKLGTPL